LVSVAVVSVSSEREPLLDVERLWAALGRALVPLAVYAASQLALLALALIQASRSAVSVANELSRWDGQWYLRLAVHGYPAAVPTGQSTLGFLPLYPAVMWVLAHLPGVSPMAAGLVVAHTGGLVSTVLAQRLAAGWWGEAAGRRAAVLYAVFPGAVVFSLLYSDGLFMALVTGCLLALDRRRWWLAGALGALATATGADGTVLVCACLTAAAVHIYRARGWTNRSELSCLAAPVLAASGMALFGVYLWLRVGTPLASFEAQRRYWGNALDPLATLQHYQLWLRLHRDDTSLLLGLLGVPFAIATRFLLLRLRDRPPAPVIAWGLGVTTLSLASAGLTPNPRMLLLAFPGSVVLGRYLRGPAFWALTAASAGLLGLVGWWTLAGHVLP
jgi:hypothetical protein